jgi:hypothetical protein
MNENVAVPLTTDELAHLRSLRDWGSAAPWTAYIEGRDHTSGNRFIMIGREDDRDEDMYIERDGRKIRVNRDSGPAWTADLELVAAARTYLSILLDEIQRLQTQIDELKS